MGKVILSDGTIVHTGFLKGGGSAGSGGETVSVQPVSGGTKTVIRSGGGGGGSSRTRTFSSKETVRVGVTEPETETISQPVDIRTSSSKLEGQQETPIFTGVQPQSFLVPKEIEQGVRPVGDLGVEDDFAQQTYYGSAEDVRQEYSRQVANQRQRSNLIVGIYDPVAQQTRRASDFETSFVKSRLDEQRQSFLPDSQPKSKTIDQLLNDPDIERIYFTPSPKGPRALLVQEKPKFEDIQEVKIEEPKEPESIYFKGFFDPKSKSFLDFPKFAGNLQSTTSKVYREAWGDIKTGDPRELEYYRDTLLLGSGAIVSFGSGAVKGFTMPFRHPIETAKGFANLFLHPIESGKEIVESAAIDPFGTAGEFYGVGKGIKTIRRASPVRVQYESFGKGGAKTIGIELGYESIGTRAYPISTLVPRFGKRTLPNYDFIKKEYFIGEDFVQPKTRVGTEVFKKEIKNIITEPTEMLIEGRRISPELQREFVLKGLESTYELRNVESKFFTKETLAEQGTKFLSDIESQAVLKTVGTQKGKVFGSFASMPQVEPSLRRVIGDIEAKFDVKVEADLMRYTMQNLEALQKASPRSVFRVTPEEPFHIEKKIRGRYEKVVEFKGEGIGEGDVVPQFAFGYDLWKSKDFMKVDKNLVAMLRGELKRKTAASIMVKDRAVGVAHTGRFKDVADYYRFTETLQKSKAGRTPKSEAFLKTAKDLGVEFRTGEIAKFEIIEKKLNQMRSPSIGFKSPSPGSPSPGFSSFPGSPSPSPISSPDLSPYLSPKAYSPDLSPYLSPKGKGSPSPSPSPDLSPYLSPSPSPSPDLSPYLSPSPGSPSPSPSPRPSPSPSPFSPSPSPSPVASNFISVLPFQKMFEKEQKRIAKSQPSFAYSPDFTAKALGIKADIKSQKDLKKLLKKQFSGLEIRPLVNF